MSDQLPVDPMVRDRIKAVLGRLALHLPPTRMPAQQFDLLLEDYLSDLAHYPVNQVEMACIEWRRKGSPHFPKVSDLIRLIVAKIDESAPQTTGYRPVHEPPPGHYVPMTAEGRAKIQRGLEELAAQRHAEGSLGAATRAALMRLGETMLKRGETWVRCDGQ